MKNDKPRIFFILLVLIFLQVIIGCGLKTKPIYPKGYTPPTSLGEQYLKKMNAKKEKLP